MSGDVEDEKHFMLDCVVYDDLRKKMFVAVDNLMLKEKGEKIEEVRELEWKATRVCRTHGRSGRSGGELDYVRLTHCGAGVLQRSDAAP